MNKKTSPAKTAIMAIIYLIVLAMYNTCLFIIADVENCGSSFWFGYGFMMGAFVLFAVSALLLRVRFVQPRDWLFGFPVLKHSTIYFIVEFILSTVFMVLDGVVELDWWVAFLVQLVALAVHLVFLLSCFYVQETIVEVQKKVKNATVYVSFLRTNVETLVAKAQDPEVKKAFAALAEEIRYSDPVSNPVLAELENQINAHITNADYYIMNNDKEGALTACESAKILLIERNKKTKALK